MPRRPRAISTIVSDATTFLHQIEHQVDIDAERKQPIYFNALQYRDDIAGLKNALKEIKDEYHAMLLRARDEAAKGKK